MCIRICIHTNVPCCSELDGLLPAPGREPLVRDHAGAVEPAFENTLYTTIYLYIYIYIYIQVCVCIYIYIFIEREREMLARPLVCHDDV